MESLVWLSKSQTARLLERGHYVRSRYMRSKAKHPEMSFWKRLAFVDEQDYRLGANAIPSTTREPGNSLWGSFFGNKHTDRSDYAPICASTTAVMDTVKEAELGNVYVDDWKEEE